MRYILLCVALVACTKEGNILTFTDQCEIELTTGTSGAPCDFVGSCSIYDRITPTCLDRVTCTDSHLVFDQVCETACEVDTDCVFGAQICEGSSCVVCPDTSGCVACPNGTMQLDRNGCPTCDCAPPSTCAEMFPGQCTGTDVCYIGADCVDGCTPGSLGCCSDQCAAKGCKGPIPAGCLTVCQTGTQVACNGACITTHCDCQSGVWQCKSTCAHGAASSCVF